MDIRYAYRYMKSHKLSKYHLSTFVTVLREYAIEQQRKHPQLPLLLFMLDFEATCIHDPTSPQISDDQKASWKTWEEETKFPLPSVRRDWPHEIIEWPVIVLVVLASGIVVRGPIFRTFVRPTENPILHPFCTYLTGITQAQVASAPTIDQVQIDFERWQRGVFSTYQMSEQCGIEHSIVVTCGDWDCNRCLAHEMMRKKLPLLTSCQYWCNLKTAMTDFGYPNIRGTNDMLNAIQLRFEGRQHSGIVDTHNYCRIIERMGELYHGGGAASGGESTTNRRSSFKEYFLPTGVTKYLIANANRCMQQYEQDMIRTQRDASGISPDALQRWIQHDFPNFGTWFIRNDMVVAHKSRDLTQSEQCAITHLIEEWALDHAVYYHSLPDFHRISILHI